MTASAAWVARMIGIRCAAQRGLDRVLSRVADGFERMVGLGVLAANVHRMGLVLQRRKRARLKAEVARSRYKALFLAA